MNTDQERQKEFVKKLLAIQQEKQNKPLSKDEQQEIAAQIGLSDADWQTVQDTYKAHLLRGRGFLSHQNYDDAIEELEQANVLDYNSIETTTTLAQAHFERFNEFQNIKDKEDAIWYSEICLTQNPSHTPSLKMISELKRKERRRQNNIVARRKTSFEKNLHIVIPMIIIFGVLTFMFLSNSPSSKYEEFTTPEILITEKVNTNQQTEKSNLDYFDANEYEIPVEVTDPKLKNLEWQTESSLLTKYSNSYKVEIVGNFLVKNALINELKIKLELFDEKGELVRTDYEEVVSDSDLTLRKGDLISFQVMKYEKTTAPNIAKIVLSSSIIDQNELNKDLVYIASPKIPLIWTQKKPQNADIEVRERQSNFSDGIIGEAFHIITLEIENTGNTSISLLKFQFNWFDSSKEVLGTEFRYGVSGSTSTLKPNQTRILSTTMSVPRVKKSELSKLTYKIEVVEIK